MRWSRLACTLIWWVAATVAQTSGAFALIEHSESTPKALLSFPWAGGCALAAATEPSPAPARVAEGLPSVAIPIVPPWTGMSRTTESSLDVVERLTARPHRQRGPPTLA